MDGTARKLEFSKIDCQEKHAASCEHRLVLIASDAWVAGAVQHCAAAAPGWPEFSSKCLDADGKLEGLNAAGRDLMPSFVLAEEVKAAYDI